MVGVALDVGVTTFRVHAAAGTSHVPQEQLQQSSGANQLHAGGMLGEPDRVDDRHHLVRPAHLADDLGDLEEVFFRDARDGLHHLGRVARIVRLHQLEDAVRVLQRHVALREAVSADRIVPSRRTVGFFLRIPAVEETIVKAVAGIDDERRVGVVAHVLIVILAVLQHVIHEPAEQRDVRAGAYAQVHIRNGGRARKTRVDVDHLRAAALAGPALRIHLREHEMLETDRMSFRRIRPGYENDVGIADVAPVVGHCSASERGGQTDHRRTVSNPGLLLYMRDAERAENFGCEVAFLAAIRGTAGERETVRAIDRVAFRVDGHKGAVARIFDVTRDLVQRVVPRQLLPIRRAGWPVHRRFDAPRRNRKLHRRRAFGAQASFVDGAVRIAFDLQQLHVAAVLPRVRDHRASDGAIRAYRMRFGRPGDPKRTLDLRRFRDVEAELGSRQEYPCSGSRQLEKVAACNLSHGKPPPHQGRPNSDVCLLLARVASFSVAERFGNHRWLSPQAQGSGLRHPKWHRMKTEGAGKLLRIFIGESDRWGRQPLAIAIVEAPRKAGLRGATVFKGIEGFGANSVIHAARIVDLSTDLPILIEIVDTEEKVRAFIPTLDEMVHEGLVTLETVEVVAYRARKDAGAPRA